MSKVRTFFLPFQSGVLSFYEDLQCLKYVNPFISIFVFYSNYPPKFFYNSTSFIPFEIIYLLLNAAFLSYEAVKKVIMALGLKSLRATKSVCERPLLMKKK